MSIPFTQYLLPNGRKKDVSIDMPSDVEIDAFYLISKGCHFDIEMLTTGAISMTCEQGDEIVSIEICNNDNSTIAGVQKLVKSARNKVDAVVER
jgi:hypothetical protein